MTPETGTRSYTAVAIVLHWAIAVAIVGNLMLGLWMHEAIDEEGTRARAIAVFQLHKSIGLSVLGLSVLRLLWRLTHRAPALPAGSPRWERISARAVHVLFYLLMFAIPLSGWLYASTQWRNDGPFNVPTIWFGLFQVPNLFGLDAVSQTLRATLSGTLLNTHEFLAWSAVVLLVLHVGAALKHQFLDHDEVLGHMIPMVAQHAASAVPRDRQLIRRVILSTGLVAIAIAVIAVTAAVFRSPSAIAPSALAVASDSDSIGSAPGAWQIDPAQSFIRFSGSNSGTPFTGVFTRWQTDLEINPDQPGLSRIAATIWTASAITGVAMYDKALREAEWFAVERYATARYQAIRIIPQADGSYAIEGELTIKNQARPVAPLRLSMTDGVVTINGSVTLKRAEFDLGMESDPSGEWVSPEIVVDVRAVATRP